MTMGRQFHPDEELSKSNYADDSTFDSDANPLYYPTDRAEAFTDAMFEKIEDLAPVPVDDTHVVFITHISGTPRVVEINTDEYNQLLLTHKSYVTGSYSHCNAVAQDIWETITDGTPHHGESL